MPSPSIQEDDHVHQKPSPTAPTKLNERRLVMPTRSDGVNLIAIVGAFHRHLVAAA